MSRRRRRLGADRSLRQARHIGEEIRLARLTLGISQRDLARLAGVSATTVKSIESGHPQVQVDTLMAVGTAAGIDVVMKAYPGATPRLRDTGQLEIAQYLITLAHPSLRGHLEVPAGGHGRSADLLFFAPDEILHVEIERMAVDFQAQYRLAFGKRDALAAAHARPVRLVLAVEDLARNRAALRPHADLIAKDLPAGSRQILAALRTGRPLGTDGLVWVRRRPSTPKPAQRMRVGG